ncbi:hypothetical protein M3Y98_01127600 [Aphelenchoides besseyi]|nr:hypothetical protein M3Y98_01127600 [Aphelenchoides besseyi]
MFADPLQGIDFWRTRFDLKHRNQERSFSVFVVLVVDEICAKNGFELILRAHQLCMDGHWTFANRRLLTLFSAPAYCNVFKNASAALRVDENLRCSLVAFVPERMFQPEVQAMITTRQKLWEPEIQAINIPTVTERPGTSSKNAGLTADQQRPLPRSYACTAGLGLEQIMQSRLVGQSNNVSRDGPVVNGLANAVNFAASADPAPQNVNVSQLTCNDFSDACLWRTSDMSLLPYYQSTYKFDANILRVATGTDVQPSDSYAITVSQSGNASDFAILESPVFCQSGNGVLMLRAWTSNGVQLQACAKADSAASFSYCSLLMTNYNQPGPFSVTIPQPTPQIPIKLYIIATDFNYTNDQYRGGFAAIDDLSYKAQDCPGFSPSTVPSLPPFTGPTTIGPTPTMPLIVTNATAVAVSVSPTTSGSSSVTSTTSGSSTMTSTSTSTSTSQRPSTVNPIGPAIPNNIAVSNSTTNGSRADDTKNSTESEEYEGMETPFGLDATYMTTTSHSFEFERETEETTLEEMTTLAAESNDGTKSENGTNKKLNISTPNATGPQSVIESGDGSGSRIDSNETDDVEASTSGSGKEDENTEDSTLKPFLVFSLPDDVTAATSFPRPIINSNQSAANLTTSETENTNSTEEPQIAAHPQLYVHNRLIAKLPTSNEENEEQTKTTTEDSSVTDKKTDEKPPLNSNLPAPQPSYSGYDQQYQSIQQANIHMPTESTTQPPWFEFTTFYPGQRKGRPPFKANELQEQQAHFINGYSLKHQPAAAINTMHRPMV